MLLRLKFLFSLLLFKQKKRPLAMGQFPTEKKMKKFEQSDVEQREARKSRKKRLKELIKMAFSLFVKC